jgi:hypothetical protein
MLVAIDKFTKWIEYKSITTLNADQVVTFIYDILHRFGFPNTIITDLRSNFHSHEFWDFYEHSSIKVIYVSVAHPRANGQVERDNGLIFDGLKKDSMTRTAKRAISGSTRSHQYSRSFAHNQAKPQASHLSFLYTGLKPYYQLM